MISGMTGGHVHDAVAPMSICGEVDQHQVAGSLNGTAVSIHQDGHRPDLIIKCTNGDSTTNLHPPECAVDGILGSKELEQLNFFVCSRITLSRKEDGVVTGDVVKTLVTE